jgi:hypothetical protein
MLQADSRRDRADKNSPEAASRASESEFGRTSRRSATLAERCCGPLLAKARRLDCVRKKIGLGNVLIVVHRPSASEPGWLQRRHSLAGAVRRHLNVLKNVTMIGVPSKSVKRPPCLLNHYGVRQMVERLRPFTSGAERTALGRDPFPLPCFLRQRRRARNRLGRACGERTSPARDAPRLATPVRLPTDTR